MRRRIYFNWWTNRKLMKKSQKLTLNVSWQYLPKWKAPARRAGLDSRTSGTVSSSTDGNSISYVTTMLFQHYLYTKTGLQSTCSRILRFVLIFGWRTDEILVLKSPVRFTKTAHTKNLFSHTKYINIMTTVICQCILSRWNRMVKYLPIVWFDSVDIIAKWEILSYVNMSKEHCVKFTCWRFFMFLFLQLCTDSRNTIRAPQYYHQFHRNEMCAILKRSWHSAVFGVCVCDAVQLLITLLVDHKMALNALKALQVKTFAVSAGFSHTLNFCYR